ncbi:MAG: SAM-dependent methyltransferase, partial [Duncaniella sp.]|nr:SAM-dependent methyltransferase [Duncaniella sp.]
PIEFVRQANWRTTAEKISLLPEAGVKNLPSSQPLTAHPLYSDLEAEEPAPGHDRGDYVAVCGTK